MLKELLRMYEYLRKAAVYTRKQQFHHSNTVLMTSSGTMNEESPDLRRCYLVHGYYVKQLKNGPNSSSL
jgi:hypothetical protein